MSAFASALFAGFVLFAGPAAAFDTDQQKCRDTIANQGIKLATTATKTFTSCHKRRVAGTIPGTTNCNLVSEADTKGKIAKLADKLVDKAVDKCSGYTPSDLLYEECPIPCNALVPSIGDFTDVGNCIACVAQLEAELLSVNGQGSPGLPLDQGESKCHGGIGKNQNKHFKTLLKERRKCQKSAEKLGTEDTLSCTGADPKGKIAKARQKGEEKNVSACTGVTLTDLDTCGEDSVMELNSCVFSTSDFLGEELFQALYNLLPGGGTTTTSGTTTTTNTTTTTMGGGSQDPQCPNSVDLVIFAGTTGISCANNGDCEVGTCDTGVGRCTTVSELDTGWKGIAHDADIVDQVLTRANMLCPGPSPTCGECTVTGLDPSTDNCRCALDNRQVCDEPFQADADDCGGDQCNCYFGVPLPLSSGNTPACVVNRFRSDIAGTVNVDTGDAETQTRLSSVVYLGISPIEPCPTCGGTCTSGDVGLVCATDMACDVCIGGSNDGNPCGDNAQACRAGGGDCGNGVCGNYDPVPNDGVRGGVCVRGENAGLSCDAGARHESFTAPGGSRHSLDCFPSLGANVSGAAGLSLDLDQTTGVSEITAAVPCASFNCHCGLCDGDKTVACTSDAECAALGAGTCKTTIPNVVQALPNACQGAPPLVCTDIGGGEGSCVNNTPDKFCDGITRASGVGFIQCFTNADCAPFGPEAGDCTLSSTRECFLPTITAQGTPDPEYPIGVATFCVPQLPAGTASAINSVAGLPGPARVINQGKTTYFCASDPGTTYIPGVGGCP